MAGVIFLSYRRAESVIHKMPTLLKVVILFFISIRVFSDSNIFLLKRLDVNIFFVNIAILFRVIFYFIVAICFFICAKTPFSHLQNLLFVPIIGTFVLMFRCVDFFPLKVIIEEIPWGLLYTVRLFITTLMAMVIFETTSAVEIIDSMNNCQRILVKRIPFFKKWNLPLVIGLSINFIPQIFFVWEQLRIAIKARTFNKKRFNFIETLRNLTVQFSGVVSCMLQRSDEIRKAVINRS